VTLCTAGARLTRTSSSSASAGTSRGRGLAYDDSAMGSSLCSRVREALESVCTPHWPVLESRRDVHLHSRQVALPLSCRRQAGQDRRFSAAAGSRDCSGTGVLPKGAGDEPCAMAAQSDAGQPYSESPGVAAPAAGEFEVEVCGGAQLQVPHNIVEQDHRAIKRCCASMKGFKSFANAAITISGIELAHRIHKRQFSFGLGRQRRGWSLKARWQRALA